MFRTSVLALSLLIGSSALADDAVDQAAGIKCKPAKDLIKVITKMSSLKPEQMDTVSANPKMKLLPREGKALPQRLFVRHDDQIIDLPISPDGNVGGLTALSSADKKSDFCVEDKALIGAGEGENSMGLSMDFDISYKNTSGSHDLAELKDGLDDGRAHIKKLVPALFRAMIPKFDHALIEYVDETGETIDVAPQIAAFKGDQKLDGLELDRLENMHFVSIDQLEALGADRLVIEGGKYKIDPSPNKEKIKELMDDE